MIVYKIELNNPDEDALEAAAIAIRNGELIVFPTETVYGLAADALSEDAVMRVFEAKGRAEVHSLPVQVAGVGDLDKVASSVPEGARKLAEKYWPGPLTLVLPKSASVSNLVTGGKATVGVRVPDHPVALALLSRLNTPIVATSANLTRHPPAVTADQAVAELGDSIAVVLDSGESAIGVSSTVVDVSVTPPRILRVGSISVEEIKDVLGEVSVQ